MYDPDRRVHFPAGVVDESPAAVIDNGRGAWSIWLSPDVTVPELANLMRGLRDRGFSVNAEHMGAGVFALVPSVRRIASTAPTATDLAEIYSRPALTLPALRYCTATADA